MLQANSYRIRAGVDLPLDEATANAKRAIQNAYAAQPREENDDALLQEAEIALNLDLDYARAQECLKELLYRNPTYNWAHFFMAATLMATGKTDKVADWLRAAERISHMGAQADFLTAAGALRFSIGEYKRALELSTMGLAISDNPRVKAELLRQSAVASLQLGLTIRIRAGVEFDPLRAGPNSEKSGPLQHHPDTVLQ
jgi:tetratricopeptide (TPR) repeat protein